MILNQVLTGNKLVGVAPKEDLTLYFGGFQVLCIELWSHLTPNFDTLYFSKITLVLEILPVSLVQFRANQEIQVQNKLIFSHKCSRKSKFAVTLDESRNRSKHLCRHYLNFIHYDQSPVNLFDFAEEFLLNIVSFPIECYHGVCWNNDPCFTWREHAVIFLTCQTDGYSVSQVRPLHKLSSPLLDRHCWVT